MLDELLFSGAFPSCPQPIDPPPQGRLEQPPRSVGAIKTILLFISGRKPRPMELGQMG